MTIEPDQQDRAQMLVDLYSEMHEHFRVRSGAATAAIHARALDSRLVLVGQSLAKGMQRLSGYPYVKPGGSLSTGGRVLDRFVKKFEYTIDPAVTNRQYAHHMDLVMRFPGRRGEGFGDIVPTATEIDASWTWIERELALFAPRVVIALGGQAATQLLGRYSNTKVNRSTKLDFDRSSARCRRGWPKRSHCRGLSPVRSISVSDARTRRLRMGRDGSEDPIESRRMNELNLAHLLDCCRTDRRVYPAQGK